VKDDFVVTDGVEDYSIVVFEKEIVEQVFFCVWIRNRALEWTGCFV
jgi:hypothetical protein